MYRSLTDIKNSLNLIAEEKLTDIYEQTKHLIPEIVCNEYVEACGFMNKCFKISDSEFMFIKNVVINVKENFNNEHVVFLKCLVVESNEEEILVRLTKTPYILNKDRLLSLIEIPYSDFVKQSNNCLLEIYNFTDIQNNENIESLKVFRTLQILIKQW